MAIDWKRGDNLKEPCRLCGGILVIRQSSRDGGLFVGCRSFPSCRFNRPIRPGDEREGGQWGEDSGYLCSECQQPQYNTSSGLTCKNGHGGADSIDPSTGEVVDRGFDDLMPDGLEDDPDPFAVNGGPEPEQTMELETVDPDMAAIEEAAAEAGIPREDYDEGIDQAAPTMEMKVGIPPLPRLSDIFDEDCGHRIRIRVSVEPEDEESDEVILSDEFTVPFDLDRARTLRAHAELGDVEIVGRLLPGIVDSVRRVIN